MKRALLCAALSLCARAQTLVPSAPASVVAGKSATITLNFTAPTTTPPIAALQWALAPPAGPTITGWTTGAASTAAGKQVSCDSTSPFICVAVGLNQNVFASGTIATAQVTFPQTLRGNVTFALTGLFASDAAGNAQPLTGGSTVIQVTSPFDVNQDGTVNALDFGLVINQMLGAAPCGTADFNGDGKCDVRDAVLFVIDFLSSTP